MPGLPDLSPLALYPLFADLARQAADVAPAALGGTATRTLLDFLASRFTDPSRRLPAALARAQDRAWRTLEVALAGETFWAMLTRRGEDKALSAELRHFLDANPLNLVPQQDTAFRRRAAEQLRQARADGLLPTAVGSPDDLAGRCASLTRFTGPAALCDAEWEAVAEVSAALRGARHDALADLLSLRLEATQPPLLAVAVRFFFRREVETHEELFRGLTYDTLTDLRGDLRTGLGALLTALERQEGWLAGLLAVAEETRDRVADVQDEIRRVNDKLDRLLDRDPRPDDSFSIRNEAERRLVRAVVARYRTLSEEDRRRLPHLLHAIARLEQSAGDLDDSLRDFQQEAAWTEDRVAKAKAHYGAYLTALERHHWDIALDELQKAATLAPARYVPFPLKKYLPERILGAGGFGVVVLCQDAETGGRLAVKALRTDELDRDAATVIAEAEQLETLEHDNIIRLRTAGFADTERTRPYLVMSFFDGTTLDEYVHKNGPLSPDDAREVARQMAAGLSAAHERGILHRDVKPANVMARKADGRWQVKLIDFGLALRRQAVQHTSSNAEALQSTSRGKSVAGTLDYAAPEQMGKIKADVGPHSDIFGFGRTMCYLLFQNPQPGPDEWEQLTDGSLRKVLGGCLKREPKERFPTFAAVRQQLGTTVVAPPTQSERIEKVFVPEHHVREQEYERKEAQVRQPEEVRPKQYAGDKQRSQKRQQRLESFRQFGRIVLLGGSIAVVLAGVLGALYGIYSGISWAINGGPPEVTLENYHDRVDSILTSKAMETGIVVVINEKNPEESSFYVTPGGDPMARVWVRLPLTAEQAIKLQNGARLNLRFQSGKRRNNIPYAIKDEPAPVKVKFP